MQEHQRKQSLARETAILAKVLFSQDEDLDDALVECERLASTAGTKIASGITQRRNSMNVATAFGKGKVEELAALVEHHEADVVIFDNDLSPAQTRNLETAVHVKVIDRTELILDIFASNASSPESRLAVELAQLEYSLPRLKRMWTHLDRVKMGVGMRGPGEKQLEVDRRLVEKRISDLRKELQVIEKRKERLVQSRSDVMTVSLVGYTNAGKSTVMNALTAADVLAEDK
ncbi:MAG: GTPase HflX, partial [Planctomycetaceae bacterium]|nr:GTPase HflX [Planctomycetaceae bacterium]